MGETIYKNNMNNPKHLNETELTAGLGHIQNSPTDQGELVTIVRRPAVGERELLTEGELTVQDGLVGDNWRGRGSSRTADGSAHPDMQLTLMNIRTVQLLAPEPSQWVLPGDQLLVDLDLSEANLPAGTQLTCGTAVLQITAQPHTGCKKFVERFGLEALKWVSTPQGKLLCLRGVNAKVLRPGVIRPGDKVQKINS